MSANPVVERFRTGQVPDQVKAAAARGALPLPPEDLLHVLFHLRHEAALQADIVKTVAELPLDPLLTTATSLETPPAMLDFLARASFRRQEVIERVLLNAGTPDGTFLLLAKHGSASLLELMMLNQIRLTRNPAIIQAILDNGNVTLSIRRRLKEIWDLHQGEENARSTRQAAQRAADRAAAEKAAAEQAPAASLLDDTLVDEPEAAAVGDSLVGKGPVGVAAARAALAEAGVELEGLDELADLEELGQSELDAAVLEQLQDEGASEEDLRLAERLLTMSVADKVQLALKGDREARNTLIRDSSKMVQESVVKSPKITEDEIEKMANMRSLSADVLRIIGNNREFTRNYTISHNLVRNPRTPQPSAMQLMARLQTRDLKFLIKDRNVSETIRRHARILIDKRSKR